MAFSAINRFFARRFTLAGRALWVAAALAAVLGVDTERSMTYQAFSLFAAFVVVGWVGALRACPSVRASRSVPRTATAGEPFAYTLRIENISARSAGHLTLLENLVDPRPSLHEFCESAPPPDARTWLQRNSGYRRWRWLVDARENAAPRPIAVERLPAGSALEVSTELTPRQRGHIHLDSITLARPDVLGIAQACSDVPCADTVLVLPRRYRLPEFVLPGARRYQQGGVAYAGSVGDSEEFLALREYRPGDPLQRVHWKSFARLGEPIVKEYQDEFFERHALVLDTFGGPEARERFEEAVSVAASFAASIDTRECLLDLMFVGDRPHRVTAGRGLASAMRLLEALATARLADHASFDLLARAVRTSRTDHAGAIVVLLGWDDARAAFVADLRASGMQVSAWVVVDAGAPAPQQAAGLHVLPVGRVQEGLARAGKSPR